MNTISNVNRSMAMDGQNLLNNRSERKSQAENQKPVMAETAAEVLNKMENSRADSEASEKELQRLTELIGSNKVQFNVNNETNKVVVRVINPSTNEVVREIPTEESRQIAEMMRKFTGNFLDEII